MHNLVIALVTTVALCFAGTPTYGGPKAVGRPLPRQFFDEETFLVASVDVGRFSIERVYQSVGQLIPSNLSAVIAERKGKVPGYVFAGAVLHEFAQNEAMRNQTIARSPNHPFVIADRTSKQLKELGIEQILIVLSWTDAEKMEFSTYVLAAADENLSEQERAKRMDGLKRIAGRFGAKVEKVPGWIAMHRQQGLPSSDDDFSLSDATFADALRVNADHDIGAVFVATERMRQQMTAGLDSALKSAKGGDAQLAALVRQIGKIADSDWQFVGVDFGKQPLIRASANFADAARAKQFGDSLTTLIRDMPRKAAAENEADKTALKMVTSFASALKSDVESTRLLLELDSASLKRLMTDAYRNLPPPEDDDPGRVHDGGDPE